MNHLPAARQPLTGCKLCGIEPARHAEQPHRDGWHRHTTPTRDQLVERLPVHHATTPPLDKATRARAVAELLAHSVTTHAAAAITRAALTAGYLWRCNGCKADHFADVVTCSCGNGAPARVR
ncbi:hypothetical protein [Streptomyces sp. NBC_01207]|uniref:hypothetical protein n=1 Tax=Streptomyces sp. NBC_01207 TaxID=2903772 RepID=UPI002E0F0A24|nr:hypothetical protein OG457_27225 [Streptomyces sp. NBC_01207]